MVSEYCFNFYLPVNIEYHKMFIVAKNNMLRNLNVKSYRKQNWGKRDYKIILYSI